MKGAATMTQGICSTFFLTAALAGALCGALPLTAGAAAGAAAAQPARAEGAAHVVFGTVRAIEGSVLSIETRSKSVIQVDAKQAAQNHRLHAAAVGHAVQVNGTYDAKGVLRADTVQRAKDSALLWPADK
jgi:hypothetical protein